MEFKNIAWIKVKVNSKNVYEYFTSFVINDFKSIEKFKEKRFKIYAEKHSLEITEVIKIFETGIEEGKSIAKNKIEEKRLISSEGGKNYLFDIASTYNLGAEYYDECNKVYFIKHFVTQHNPEIIINIGKIVGEYWYSWQKVLENHRIFEQLFKKEVDKHKKSFLNKPMFLSQNVEIIDLPGTMQIFKNFLGSITHTNSLLKARRKELLSNKMNNLTMSHIFKYDALNDYKKQCLDFLQETTNNMDNQVYNKYKSDYNYLLKELNNCISTLKTLKPIFIIDMSFVPYYFHYNENWFKHVFDMLNFTRISYLKITKAEIQTELTGFKSNFKPQQIEILFEQLKGVYIDKNTNKKYFMAIFEDNVLPDKFINKKINWNKSIPLFCSLFFGYSHIEYQKQFLSFNGIINKETIHFYKKAIQFFSFDKKKVSNKTLSEKSSKLCDAKAPQNFDKLYSIIKTVQTSTI